MPRGWSEKHLAQLPASWVEGLRADREARGLPRVQTEADGQQRESPLTAYNAALAEAKQAKGVLIAERNRLPPEAEALTLAQRCFDRARAGLWEAGSRAEQYLRRPLTELEKVRGFPVSGQQGG